MCIRDSLHRASKKSKKKQQTKLVDKEFQINLRGVLSQKQQLILCFEKAYLSARSEKDFYALLKKENLEVYLRNGKQTGVILNRKYRFSTLGFTQEKLQKLELNITFNQRKKELEEIQKQEKEKGREQ